LKKSGIKTEARFSLLNASVMPAGAGPSFQIQKSSAKLQNLKAVASLACNSF